MDGIEGLSEVDESQNAAEVVGPNSFKQTPECYNLSDGRSFRSESILCSSEQRIKCRSQSVHDEAIVELHDQRDEADSSVIVGLGENILSSALGL